MLDKPVRGVNLGGWLVLEKWITPSLFSGTAAVDEYTFCQNSSNHQKLKDFRDSFITKQDFEWLATHGVEALRLPVGYWLFGNEPPFLATKTYVDNAFKWAEQTGLKILLDLHGAPGSQNGKDHSGHIKEVTWYGNQANISKTLSVVRKIAECYGNSPAIYGISLLNEPSKNIPNVVLLEYYKKAYGIIRQTCGNELKIIYNDIYAPAKWSKALPKSKYKNVCMDIHHYQIFTSHDKALSPRLNLLRSKTQLPLNLARFRHYHPVIIGEWSLTLGSRNLKNLNPDKHRKIIQSYAKNQLHAYQKSAAWFFWTYKTEGKSGWNFRDCLEKGLLS
jgi:glucan 1,3-beta-glucosidase